MASDTPGKPPADTLPDGLRAKAFASIELVLDLVYAARSIAPIDLESILIYFCVCEATMRPLVLNPDTPTDVMVMAEPPEVMRGSISRLLVADRVGLPRETVRRKISSLLTAGLLVEDAEGRVRSTRNLGDAQIQKIVTDAHAAVQRYNARLRRLGVRDSGQS